MVTGAIAVRSGQMPPPPPQSQADYLKEAYGMVDESEWPTLSLGAAPHHAQHRSNSGSHCATPTIGRGSAVDVSAMLRSAGVGNVPTMNGNAQSNGVATSAPKNPKLYKTELCRSWMDSARCNYGDRCQYAHGEPEKRPIPRHPKYKTEACQSYHQSGYCPYGPRCHFVHNEDPAILEQLVAANAAATATTKHQQPQQQQQQPTIANHSLARPTQLLFGRSAASAVGGRPGSAGAASRSCIEGGPAMIAAQAAAAAVAPNSSIAAAAAMAAVAYNQQPQLFSRQFQTQLLMYNDGMKNHSNNNTNAAAGINVAGSGSTGDSPIPSSNDSGTDSPYHPSTATTLHDYEPGLGLSTCSFGVGADIDDPSMFFVRRQLEMAKQAVRPAMDWPPMREFATMSVSRKQSSPAPQQQQQPAMLQRNGSSASTPGDQAPPNLLPGSFSDIESGFLSSSSSCASSSGGGGGSGGVTKALSSPTGSSPPSFGVARLPVFERLASGP